MLDYEIMYIATNPILIIAIYKLFRTLLGEEIYNRRLEIISYMAYFVVLSTMVFITRIPLLTMIITLSVLFLISLNYNYSMQKRITICSLIYAILLIIELIGFVAAGYFNISVYQNSLFDSLIWLLIIRLTTFIFSFLLSRYKKSVKNDFPIPKIYFLGFALVLLGTLYLFINSLQKADSTAYDILISGTVLIIVNLILLFMNEKIYNSLLLKTEQDILKQQNISYENQTEIINQSTLAIKSLRHDMKNHLFVLHQLYEEDKKEQINLYIDDIIEQIDNKANLSQSNNFIFDSIINFKLQNLQNHNVKIKVDVNVPQTINILAFDITVILGNLLDNAIAAIEKSNNKELTLSINCSKGNLIIFLDNSFNGELIEEGGQFKTTKNFKTGHGFGLKNIEKSLAKYDGEMRIDYNNTVFSVTIIIPYGD